MEASADADHLRATLDQNLQEIDALRIANRKANDANKLLQQDISGLAHELKEAKALDSMNFRNAVVERCSSMERGVQLSELTAISPGKS